MALSPNQEFVIGQCDRNAIKKEFAIIARNCQRNRWLLSGNRYAADTIKTIRDDASANRPLNQAQMRQYIAASSATHCMDGWSYLGRAIEAHLRGDADVSRHLAYYAELRATMALLASEGIGIFDNRHFIVDRNRTCIDVPAPITGQRNRPGRRQRTHVFTWEALEFWAQQTSAADLIYNIIQPGNIPLSEWLLNFGMGSGFRSILAGIWLRQWGLDLSRLAEDREARNIASYRPTAFTAPRALSLNEAINHVKEFWNVYEPQDSLRFPELDKYILKNSLELYFRVAHRNRRTHKQANKQYKRQIESMLHSIAPIGLPREEWIRFLLSSTGNLIIDEAKGTAGPDDQQHHKQVIARASLLLRLATGSCQKLFATVASLDKSRTRFWWSSIGEDHCLWHSGEDPIQFTDLWADIREAIKSVERWITNTPNRDRSYYKLWNDVSEASSKLSTCERIGLWGLGI